MILAAFPIIHHTTIAEAIAGDATASTTTLTMTSGHTAANLNLVPHDNNGTFSMSSSDEQASFTVSSNNYTGYTLSIKHASSDNGQLTNSDTGSALDTIESYTDADTFTNGSSALYNGKWGYKPSKYNSTTNTYFRPSPTTVASTLNETSCANGSPTTLCPNNQAEDTYTIGLGARVDYSKPAGTYTNTFVLTAVGNAAEYTITYADNSGDSTVANMPSATTGNTTDLSVELTTDVPTRDHYNFTKWCLGTVSDNGMTCTGTEYASGADFGIDQTTTNLTTLYAVWEESYEGYLQDFTAAQCDAMEVQTTKILRDNRDNQDYTIAKLADGNCWMDNLNLGDTDNYPLTGDLTSANTNLASTITASTFSGWKKTLSAQTYTEGELFLVTGTDSVSNAKYGALYNYYAASAGTISGDSNTNDAIYDICPKGWRLPTTTNTNRVGETGSLYNNYYNSVSSMHNSVANNGAAFSFNGYTANAGASSVGSAGFYWSSTYGGGTGYRRYLKLTSSSASPGDYILRKHGLAMRCIRKTAMDEAGIKTMQDIGNLSVVERNTLLESMPTGVSYELYDSRDGENYFVAKLADGNLWLQDNLRLRIGTSSVQQNITSATTNATDTILGYLKNGGGSSPYPSNGIVQQNAVNTAWADSYNRPYEAIAVKDTWSMSSEAPVKYGPGSGKIGIYYNFCAASAGSYCYASGQSNGSNAKYDICPKGWRMPTGGPGGEYKALYIAYSSNVANFRNALSTPISGYFRGSSAMEQGTYGHFWSSTNSDNYTYELAVNTSQIQDSLAGRAFGLSVRCVLKTEVEHAYDNLMAGTMTMQEFGTLAIEKKAELINMMEEDTNYNVIDPRDNKTYTIAKIYGNVWMTSNLSIGCNGDNYDIKTLTSADSNVESEYQTSSTVVDGNYSFSNATQTCSSTYGAWYNYTAATAGTISGDSNSNNAIYDICPKGWRLPGEYDFVSITSKSTAFNPVGGDYYYNTSRGSGLSGYPRTAQWWSADSAGSTIERESLYNNGGSIDVYSHGSPEREYGLYTRCIMKSPFEESNISTMQEYSNLEDGERNRIFNNLMMDNATYGIYDSRDNSYYTIAKINNNLWMTRNLAIGCSVSGKRYGGGSTRRDLSSADSNISTNWSMLTGNTTSLSSGDSYTEPRRMCYYGTGAWYNYAAATAGTALNDSNITDATYDICPKGWRLPTKDEFTSIASYDYVNVFNPSIGGRYMGGTREEYNGNWAQSYYWTSTAANAQNRYTFDYKNRKGYARSPDNTQTSVGSDQDRAYGLYIRCIKSK